MDTWALTAGDENVLSEALSEPHPEVAATAPAASSGCSNDAAAAAAAANAARQLRGRMALLKQKLGEENEVRADLLQEEHNQRLQLMTVRKSSPVVAARAMAVSSAVSMEVVGVVTAVSSVPCVLTMLYACAF